MRHFITASMFGICFVFCSVSPLCPKASFSFGQGADTSAPQASTQAVSWSVADFEFKIDDPVRGILVRRKGTSEWIESMKLDEPVVVGLLDGTSKIYVPSKAVKPPKTKHMQPPKYPESEQQAGRKGEAFLHAIVDDRGTLRLLTVDASPSPEFAAASLDAVKKWTFKPARLNEKPVAVLMLIDMRFGL
jgi:TonB family protein